MLLPDHLSVSQINKYLLCPLAYRFAYVDRIETGVKASGLVLGTAFHAAADTLHKHLINGGVREPKVYRDVLGDSLSVEFGNFDIRTKDGEDRDALTEEGGRLIDVYREYRTTQPGQLIATEHRVERDLAHVRTGELLGLPFVAYLDLIEKDDDGLVVVDLKTAGRSYSQQDADLNLQLTGYGLLVLLETTEPPRSLRIDAVVRNKTPRVQRLETTRTECDFVRFWSLAGAVRKAMESGAFYPNPGWACAGCEYADHCRRWGDETTKGGAL
jgi:putative RecB family exonuclease